eukprot:TRINITY_DN595_c0_g1_i1.p1 TRINITY_DN595_c0_g1~~TRINITY_DN595_c0_g1_i1.p1  ORF type:complete len:141 (+),score=9.51 TRINITY_DN595_c0_g1_i1:110-532(+)
MSKFIALSIVILSCLFVWMPSYAAADDLCSQYDTNSTCLGAGCNCAFLICDGKSSCVPANTTSGAPLQDLDSCTSYSFCWNCVKTSPIVIGTQYCASHENAPKGLIAGIIIGIALVVGGVIALIVFCCIRKRRQAAYNTY